RPAVTQRRNPCCLSSRSAPIPARDSL
ncbi:uncharacterized protein METZ01_LOCUS358977, partial [marine metagenome]